MATRCLVIGGSGTLGRRVCGALLAAGASVAFTYRTGREAALALEGRGARGFQLDLLDAAAIGPTVDAAADALGGGLDALVHCAGVAAARAGGGTTHESLDEITAEGFDRLMAINVRSAFLACQRLVRHAPGGGNVVLVGSVDGVKPVPTPIHYGASRGALRAMAQGLSKELGPRQIRVNVVAPGVLEGGLGETVPAASRAEYLKHSALKRLGAFDEVTSLVAWLALENTYVTGQTILLDGGL
jgi:NAD(P)-dependent dehydrogenase (short-subunit alcohol dehydrogenase family)